MHFLFETFPRTHAGEILLGYYLYIYSVSFKIRFSFYKNVALKGFSLGLQFIVSLARDNVIASPCLIMNSTKQNHANLN